jgi:hypothetical protein
MNPFVMLGLGLQSTNPGLDTFTCRDAGGSETHACVPIVTGGIPGTPSSRTWALREQLAPLFALGVGGDLRFDRAVFLRAELSDRVFKPAVNRAEQAGAEWNLTSDENAAKLVHQVGVTVGVHLSLGSRRAPDMALARARSIKAATEADEVEQCPEISFWDPTQFQSAPVRASVVGTVTTARRALQAVLGRTSYRHAQSDEGSVVTDWSPVYADPGPSGRLRKHALFFEFVPEIGGTDIVVRWLTCSSPAPEGRWVVTLADKLAQPPDIKGLMAAIRQR